ncbi:PP2C family protein-serine/threonine phosphatase [Anaerocolumna jejuensis]|uniref:PP2C family protein-serine/threonine phosphatase n=1 Tax=Anaerocolumna jejuensis TaxID=259063 RepID=UPI003F7B5921
MGISYYIIGVLAFVIVLLEIAKLFIRPDKHDSGWDRGFSMTIGNCEVQEDLGEVSVIPAGMMAVLSDGMGKAYGGRIASRIAVNTFVDIFEDYNAFHNPQYYFRKAFHSANKEILKALEGEERGAASVSSVLLRKGYLYYAVAGNVKICVYREKSLVPVSAGHTVAVLAEQRFYEGKLSRQDAVELLENHRLYNFLGRDGFQDIELFDAPIRLKHNDIVVLMSDGVYDLLGFKEVERVLEKQGSCQQMALEIIEAVNRNNSPAKDNASIILLRVRNGVTV